MKQHYRYGVMAPVPPDTPIPDTATVATPIKGSTAPPGYLIAVPHKTQLPRGFHPIRRVQAELRYSKPNVDAARAAADAPLTEPSETQPAQPE